MLIFYVWEGNGDNGAVADDLLGRVYLDIDHHLRCAHHLGDPQRPHIGRDYLTGRKRLMTVVMRRSIRFTL